MSLSYTLPPKTHPDEHRLALFDLDETILSGDSDYLWGLFLVEHGKVSEDEYATEHRAFKQAYTEGRLDMVAYVHFSTRALRRHPRAEIAALCERFVTERIMPLCHPEMIAIMKAHQHAGDHVMVITATNHFVVAPIVKNLPADELIATDLEELDGVITGRIAGTPSFREGKVARVEDWLARHPQYHWEKSFFYSDSANDRFLLERVAFPVIVNGDAEFCAYGKERGWTLLNI